MKKEILDKLTIKETLEAYVHYVNVNELIRKEEDNLPPLPQELREWTNPIEDTLEFIIGYLKDKVDEIQDFLSINLLERYELACGLVDLSKAYDYEMTGYIYDIIMNYTLTVKNPNNLREELVIFYKTEAKKPRSEMLIFKSEQERINERIGWLLYRLVIHLKNKEENERL